MIPQDLLPTVVTLTFDVRVVVFCAAAALFVGLLFGLAPAWQATEFSAAHAMASDSRTATGRGGRIRTLIVVGQVSTAAMLLFGAGLLLRTLLAIESVDRGYHAQSVLTMLVDPPGPQRVPWLPFYEAVGREIQAMPGVEGVTWATTLPLGRSYQGRSRFEIVGDPPPAESQPPTADYQIVGPTYFRTLDLPVVAGREFDDHDTPDNRQVCIVNEAFVQTYLHGRSPIGVRVAVRPTASAQAPSVVREIVGVARQVKARPNETEDLIQIYVPLAQDTPGDIFLLVRPTSGRAEVLTSSVRGALARVDTEQIVSVRNVMTLDDVVSEATLRHRFRAMLVGAFAWLAMALAMVGLSGVLAYSVQQRVRDFGVRRALGATTSDVLRLVARSTIRIVALGAAIGLVLSIVMGRLLVTMLFGVRPLDATTFGFVTIVLALTSLAAAIGPAWRAARVDPITALRTE
jgi:putative ABC transport system permease protein